jgi:hypothetical protein
MTDTYIPESGDLQFTFGLSFFDRLIRLVTGGPSHVRVILSPTLVAEMVPQGFRFGDPRGHVGADGKVTPFVHSEIVPTRLDQEHKAALLAYVRASYRTRYAWIGCASDFFNRIGCPLTLGVIGQQNCSQFAAAALGWEEWATQTPNSLYLHYKQGA